MSRQPGPDDEIIRLAFAHAPVALSILALDGRQIAGNAAYAALLHLDPDDVAGLDVAEITPPDRRGWTADYLARLASGEIDEFVTQKRFLLADGTEQLVKLITRPIERDGTRVALIGVLEPVIDAPPIERDARLRKLIENISDEISLLAADGTMIETSGRYKPILGYPTEFWEGRTIFDLLHPDDVPAVLELREQVLARPGAVLSGEFSVRAADGAYRPLEVHCVNLLHDPDVRGVVVTSRNIAKERELLADLATSRDDALAEADLRMRLIATVSHELRNPLHAMSGLAELLTTTRLTDEAATLAAALRRQIEGLRLVVDDLLDSSRLGVGAVALNAQPIAVRSLVEDVVAMSQLAARGQPLRVVATVRPDVPEAVLADATRLRQVLANLLGNAVKFTEHGEVVVDVDVAAPDTVVFEVRDTGRGIAPDELQSVFEPFTTGANAGPGSGAGLGLTIVRQLVALMHGTITVDSEVGAGSTFTLALPLPATQPPEISSIHTPPISSAGLPVLVVEDDEVNQMLAARQLDRLGMRAVIVGSGEAALELLAKGKGPDIVLMDFQMPGIDGLETTRRLRELERETGRRAAVIGVTASAMVTDRAACALAGMDDFLAKPVSLVTLGATLGKWLRGDADAAMSNAVDPAVLDELAVDLGDRVVVIDLVRTYLTELPARRAAVVVAGEAGDVPAAKRAAHLLRSCSLLLGAEALGEACRAMSEIETADEVRAQALAIRDRSLDAAAWFGRWLDRAALTSR